MKRDYLKHLGFTTSVALLTANKSTMDNNTQLPAEVVEEIKELQDKLTSIIILDDSFNKGYYSGMRTGIEAGATEYATKLHQVEQENAQLKRWKMEAVELLTPINAYVHKHIEKSLGQSCVKLVLERCEQYETARTLLEKFISRHEAGLLPDRGIYDEIKTFLDGKK